jgi:rod shape-determining protein MreC
MAVVLRYLKEYRFYIALFLLILIPVISIDTSTRSPRDYRFYDRVLVAFTSPIQASITWSLDRIATFFQNYLFLLNTRQEVALLVEESRKHLGTIAALRETEQENIRLKRLLNFVEQHRLEAITARVIGRDASTEFRAIRINRGETSGVRKNMAVLTSEGVVGRILRTTADTADVVTLHDLLLAVDSIVERSRARGIVEGKTDEICQLKYALRTDDIQVGDVLVTSGLGGLFPKGVPVGSVIRVDRKPFGISQDVDIKPSVDFSRLEEVSVIVRSEREPVAKL